MNDGRMVVVRVSLIPAKAEVHRATQRNLVLKKKKKKENE